MERIKQMSLKKSLFTIALINSTIALILSVVSFWGCMELSSAIAPQGVVLDVHTSPITMTELPEPTAQAIRLAEFISILQIILPILICIAALLATASLFYRLKLKEPLALLADGASRIMDNDLDFMMEAKSRDELGQLCIAFETMRKTLLENNRELWRQAEERKRLNATFSHNLRNPVTVLKGSVKLAGKSIADGTVNAGQLTNHLSLIEGYTNRIERYIETMSSIQKLEEIPLVRENIDWNSLIAELENMIHFVGADSGRQINFKAARYFGSVLIDKSILFQIAENLVSNALRFAERRSNCFRHIKDMPYLFVKSWLPNTKINGTGTRSADNSANHAFSVSLQEMFLILLRPAEETHYNHLFIIRNLGVIYAPAFTHEGKVFFGCTAT